MQIELLSDHTHLIDRIARVHFEQWGILTGADSIEEYRVFLEGACTLSSLPLVTVALRDGVFLGSASVISCDMDIRKELTPWLAQVYVLEEWRGQGVGAALVNKASEYANRLGFQAMYLYTSGTLPHFYQNLGWIIRETAFYLGKERTIMERGLV